MTPLKIAIQSVHTSGAHISYECGLGRRFVDAGIHQEFLNFTCETKQDGTAVWRPFPKLQPCEWVACIDAPAAPNGTNLADLRVNGNETYDYAITGKAIKNVLGTSFCLGNHILKLFVPSCKNIFGNYVQITSGI